MALFKKNKKEESSYPSGLPELPKLPELPPAAPRPNPSTIPKPNALPRFPSSPTGNRFSQNTIKDAVSGEKGGDAVDEFEKEIQKMPRFPDKSMAKEPRAPRGDEEDEEEMTPSAPQNPEMIITPRTSRVSSVSQREEPVFIRLDKFEESLDTFEKIKKQLSGADKLLNEIKDVKDREDKELAEWQSKLEAMKNQIEKIDKDIFSKV